VVEVSDGLGRLVAFRQLDAELRMELFDGQSTVQDEEVPNSVIGGQWWRVRELDAAGTEWAEADIGSINEEP